MGGTGNVVKCIRKINERRKYQIIKDAEVTEIISNKDKVNGIKINNSEDY